jgi:hypothetical protein
VQPLQVARLQDRLEQVVAEQDLDVLREVVVLLGLQQRVLERPAFAAR